MGKHEENFALTHAPKKSVTELAMSWPTSSDVKRRVRLDLPEHLSGLVKKQFSVPSPASHFTIKRNPLSQSLLFPLFETRFDRIHYYKVAPAK
jgi:hypothetical protein